MRNEKMIPRKVERGFFSRRGTCYYFIARLHFLFISHRSQQELNATQQTRKWSLYNTTRGICSYITNLGDDSGAFKYNACRVLQEVLYRTHTSNYIPQLHEKVNHSTLLTKKPVPTARLIE